MSKAPEAGRGEPEHGRYCASHDGGRCDCRVERVAALEGGPCPSEECPGRFCCQFPSACRAPSLPEGDDGMVQELLDAATMAEQEQDHATSRWTARLWKADAALFRAAAARLTEQHQVEVDREWWKNVAAEAAKQLKDAEKREKHAGEALEKEKQDAERYRFLRPFLDTDGDVDNADMPSRFYSWLRIRDESVPLPDAVGWNSVDEAIDAAIAASLRSGGGT